MPNLRGYRVGKRGNALLFFAGLDLVYAYSLFCPGTAATTSEQLRWLAGLAPLWTWACLWAAAGLACAWSAFRRHDQAGYAAAITIKVLWGAASLGGWLLGNVDRGYVAAAVWLAFAAHVANIASWPEPDGKEPVWTRPSP